MNSSWKVVLAFIAVFVAGIIFGGGFALRISKQVVRREESPPPVMNPMPKRTANPQAPAGTQLLRRFVEGLELTTEQRDKLRPLVLHAEEQIAAVRQKSLEETAQILRDLQQNFRAELNPEQRKKLARMQQKQMENIRLERARKQQQGFGPNQPFSTRPNQRTNQGQPPGPQNQPPNFGPGQPQPQNQGAPEFSAPQGPPPGGRPANPPLPDGTNPLPRNP
jgi:hypothetical protein